MITDFLGKPFTPDELSAALKVVRAFKEGENLEEWAVIPFTSWAKLEQLEECLAHRVEGAPLTADTLAYIEKHKEASGE